MKDTAMNAIPNNGTMNITGFPCYELYVTKSLFLTESRNDSSHREWQASPHAGRDNAHLQMNQVMDVGAQ